MADEPTETSSAPSPTWAALRAGAISFVVGAAIAGGGVWYTQSQEAAAQAQQLQGQVDACTGQKTALDATIRSLTNDKRILQVRADLARATDALGESNFGTANKHLEEARAHFAQVQPAPAGAFASSLSGLEIQVAEDLEAQIERIDGLAEQLDGMLSAK